MLKELIISFKMFDEFEGLLADDIEDMEDGPGLGCISPEHSKRREFLSLYWAQLIINSSLSN